MANVAFFSFRETDRGVVLTIKGRALNSSYSNLDFRVKDLLKRWKTDEPAVIKQAITKARQGTSRTIVFVGQDTYKSEWVKHEVEMTLGDKKPVYAIRLKDTNGPAPKVLTDNKVKVYDWSESTLQRLATL